jgi:hypothetical protein
MELSNMTVSYYSRHALFRRGVEDVCPECGRTVFSQIPSAAVLENLLRIAALFSSS